MPASSVPVVLNGTEVWAYVEELADGLRVRVGIDDWEKLGLFRGQRIVVRLPGKADAAYFLAEVTDAPPVVWVTLARRVRAAG